MSISQNFPAIRPTLNLDFANVGRLDPRITFTRASTATYFDANTTAKAEENLLLYSQEFNDSYWAKTGSTVTANDTTAPDGTATAEAVLETAITSTHTVNRSSIVSSGTYTASCHFKANGRDYALLALFSAGAISIDLVAGTATGVLGSPTNIFCTSLGNGWYRAGFTVTISSSSNFNMYASEDGVWDNRTYAGDITKGIYIWGAQLEQRSAVTAYTPTTTQAITNYIPVLETAASGVARFDHNPTTGESLGLLVEEQRTNLLTYSAEFDNAAWTTSSPYSVVTNASIAPDGTQAADSLVVADGQSSFSVDVTRQVVTKAASAIQYTRSIYAKALGAATSVRFYDFGLSTSNAATVVVSLVDGSVLVSPTAIGNFSGASVVVTNAGNGWWRIALTYTTDTHTSLTVRTFPYVGGSALTGDGYSGIFIWGAQLEAGAFPTSYIPTTTTALTRSADNASMTGTNFSSWFNAAEGTVYAEATTRIPYAGTNLFPRLCEINNADSTTNGIRMLYGVLSTETDYRGTVSVNGVAQYSSESGESNGGRQILAYKTDDFSSASNGTLLSTDTSGTLPVVNTLFLGIYTTAGLGNINGTIKKFAYYPVRLANAQLQALTG